MQALGTGERDALMPFPGQPSLKEWDRLLELFHCKTNRELADIVGISPSQMGRIIRGKTRLGNHLDTLVEHANEHGLPQEVFDLLGVDLPHGENVLKLAEAKKSGFERLEFPAIESSIWSWGLSFRNSPLLEELAGHALRNGLSCRRFLDGLVLGDEPGSRGSSKAGPGLFPDPESFGLKPGTVVMLGASARHEQSIMLQKKFVRILDARGVDVEIREYLTNPIRPSYYGYPTVAKFLRVGKKTVYPLRYVEGDGSMVYVDGAAIFNGTIDRLYHGQKPPYGKKTKRLILVAALQRLANGIAVRFLRDPGFRRKWVPEYDPEKDGQFGLLVFKVTAVNDEYGTRIRDIAQRCLRLNSVATSDRTR